MRGRRGLARVSGLLVIGASGLVSGVAEAAASLSPHGPGPLSPSWFLLAAALSFLPFVLLMMTCFVRISVVLSILKNALGAGSALPPSSVVSGLALILTLYIMAPTGQRMVEALLASPGTAPVAGAPAARSDTDVAAEVADRLSAIDSVPAVVAALDRVKEPLRDFLVHNAAARERATFLALRRQMVGPTRAAQAPVSDRDFLVLLPAFVTSELRRAFEIGFLLFLPFLILELVISNLLTALGMSSLAPALVALPFKLLLFVLVDGWHLLARGLVQSYL